MNDIVLDKVGKLKLVQNRAKEYITLVQFVLVAYTSIQLTPLEPIHFILATPAFILLLYLDWKVLYPSFQYSNSMKNPVLKQILKQTKK